MAFTVVNHGEADALRAVVAHTAATDLILQLFTNDATVGEATVAADLTEADFSGYEAKTLAGASWTITEGAPSTAEYAEQTFAPDGSISGLQLVYGAMLVRATSGRLFAVEKFSAPRPVERLGDSLAVTPSFSLD